MAAGKVTKAVDEITAKTGLRVAHLNLTGYKASKALGELGDKDFITKEILVAYTPAVVEPFVYNLPAGSKTPIIVDFDNNTIKFGTDAAIDIGTDLSVYQGSQDNVIFKLIDAVDDTITKPYNNVQVLVEQWFDNTYQSLTSISLLPDTDTGLSGGLTLDNINMIIKP